MKKRNSAFPWMVVLTLGISVIVKLGLILWGWFKVDFDPNAPVPYRVFVGVVVVETVAILYLLLKVLWIGTPALLK